MWLILAVSAMGAPPDDLRPVLAPPDVHVQYAAFVASAGWPEAELACTNLWPDHAEVCWRTDNGRGPWVTTEALDEWGVDLAGLQAWATIQAAEALSTGWTEQPVDGLASYWTGPHADGWAAVSAWTPSRFVEVVGTQDVLVAIPVNGVIIAWSPGNSDMDRAVAVGVRKMHDELDSPVSAMIHRWTAGAWTTFGEAVPR